MPLLKIKLSKKDKDTTKNPMSKTMRNSIIIFALVAVSIGVNAIASYNLRDTVEIVKLKSSVSQDGRVTEENMYSDKMVKAEYEKQGIYTLADGTKRRSIVLWEDRRRITEAYASYYVRQDTPLYWDSLSKESPKQYSYLYKMDGELAKVDLDAQEFGKMLVPGDKINVRASYEEQSFVLPTEKEFMMQQQTGIQAQTTIKRQVMLFNSATVLDMLNQNGESIFDLYYQLLALPKAEQNKQVASDEFKERVKASKILLNVTAEEADRYQEIQSQSPSMMMTLLPRSSGNLITEALNELQIGLSR